MNIFNFFNKQQTKENDIAICRDISEDEATEYMWNIADDAEKDITKLPDSLLFYIKKNIDKPTEIQIISILKDCILAQENQQLLSNQPSLINHIAEEKFLLLLMRV